jgi:hypothetical protein
MSMVIRYVIQFANTSKIHAEINRGNDKAFRCSFFSMWEKTMISLKASYASENEALEDLQRAIKTYYRSPTVGIREDSRFLN